MNKHGKVIVLTLVFSVLMCVLAFSFPKNICCPSNCPVVAQRIGYGPLERWHDCDGDGKPDFKIYYAVEEDGLRILKIEKVKFHEKKRWHTMGS